MSPLQQSTAELTMQSLIYEASHFLDNGKLKKSYDLYIQALCIAIDELKQLEFINQCVAVTGNLSSIFVLAHTCLGQAKEISNTKQPNKKCEKPIVPPKPSHLSPSSSVPPTSAIMKRKQQIIFGSHSLRKTASLDTRRSLYDSSNKRYHLGYHLKEYDDDDEDEDDAEEDNDDVEYNVDKSGNNNKNKSKKGLNKIKLNTVTIKRRSSTSNLTPTSPTSTPMIRVASTTAVTTTTTSSTTTTSTTSTSSSSSLTASTKPVGTSTVATAGSVTPSSFHTIFSDDYNVKEQDLLIAGCTIDPKLLVTVQTSTSNDSLLSSQATTKNNAYLPMIPQAPLVSIYQSLQQRLESVLTELKKRDNNKSEKQVQYIHQQQLPKLKTQINRVRNIHMSATTVPTILQFQPVLIAYQLTLIDSRIFRNISVEALLSHSSPKRPHPSITLSTDFFNYLTRLIEHSILLHQDASGRAQLIHHWIKVAGKCHELKNYQTLKAVISALGTPPIQRLKRSWAFVPKKSLVMLEDLSELMSESCNYGKYRELMGMKDDSFQQQSVPPLQQQQQQQQSSLHQFQQIQVQSFKKLPLRKNSLILLNEPIVPFLGTFLHDMTYLIALQQHKQQQQDDAEEEEEEDPRLLELLQLFKTYQHCPPYSITLTQGCLKELNKNRKHKLSHALTRNSPMKKKKKKTPLLFFQENETDELCVEMQQCLVTQYLLTRSWVSEKTVDELSLVREPPKTCRSYSETSSHQQQHASIHSTTTTGMRSSSGSLTASGSSGAESSSTSSRPMSLEDDDDDMMLEEEEEDDDEEEDEEDDLKEMVTNNSSTNKNTFWLFGRKSVDQGYVLKSNEPIMTTMGGLHRSPRHFSFDDLNTSHQKIVSGHGFKRTAGVDTIRMQRDGSQGSFTLFRKEFWKSEEKRQQPPVEMMTRPTRGLNRRGSYSSLVQDNASSSSSSTANSNSQRAYNTISPGKLKHALSSPHPLDASAKNIYL